ncbi:MAG: tyrosine--tRNA ligase [Simkaniaceae bacterium]|nr:tyrosine--tRNA ligase [Simkaniaceae bacterium]
MGNVIECLERRGFIEAMTSEELKKLTDKPIKLYVGFDPTADSLHLGNLIGIIALAWFQKFGHTPVVLLGGGTGKIGDPSGKNMERPLLDLETLQKNIAAINEQFSKCLCFDQGENKAVTLNNDDWLSQFKLVEFLRDVGRHFRLGTMLAKDSVKSRLQSDEGMSFTEFTYQILQGYDFYHLHKNHDITVQMGGSDQWGNITAGIELTRRLSRKSVYGITFPLLKRSDGRKFGKSEEGAVWLSPQKTSPYKFYQYLFSTPDSDVIRLLRMLTFLELEEINKIEEQMKKSDYVPNSAQKRLAEEVTRYVHGEEGLEVAKKVTLSAAPGSSATLDVESLKEIANDMPNISIDAAELVEKKYVEIAVKIGLLSSKGEATRLIKNGGAYLNNQKITDALQLITKEHFIGGKFMVFSAGKKKKILVNIL